MISKCYKLKSSLSLLALVIVFAVSGQSWASETRLTLDEALTQALSSNPEIAAYEAKAEAERSAIRAQYAPENPRFGLMREKGMTLMEQQTGPMNSWQISQGLLFPTKYFQMGTIQSARAEAADEEKAARRLEIRTEVVSGYYDLFSIDRVLTLLEAQRETLRQIARIAESRHATGAVPQQDEMKAHVEQTKIENEILMTKEERDSMEAMLNALLAREASESISLPKGELPVPKLLVPIDEISGLAHAGARHIRHGKSLVDEAESKKSLAKMGYLPDFSVSYQKAFTSSPGGNYAVGVELSIPLWFLAKQSSEVASASARVIQAEKELESTIRSTHAQVRSLSAKVRTQGKVLEIYTNALIPQASTTLNSSRASYQAGRSTFTDLLDSERILYDTQMAYYRTLSQYAANLAKLEEMAGTSLSSLPFGVQP